MGQRWPLARLRSHRGVAFATFCLSHGVISVRYGRSDRNHLHAINARGDDFAILDGHGAGRAPALFDIIEGASYGPMEKRDGAAYLAPAFSSRVTMGA